MTEFRVLIVDDEKLARASIKSLLDGRPGWRIVGEAANGRDAIRLINQLKPDLVFLDIEMPKLNGMNMLKELVAKPVIVVTTAYDNYAIGAFEENAIDYLLKPYTDERFYKTLARAQERLTEAQSSRKLETISKLLTTPPPQGAKSFQVQIGDTLHRVEEKDVIWVSASGNYVELHTHDRAYLYRETIAHLAEVLSPKSFVRINRSFIVRIDQVKHLKKHHSGEYIVFLKNNVELKLSRTYRDQVSILLGLG